MPAKNIIKVMLVDDHAVVRSGLAAFLSVYPDLEMVAQASGGKDAVEMCRDAKPDVVLMDLVMPDMDGAAATRLIRDHCPDIQVIALTSFPEENLVRDALQAGAIGYLLKNVGADELADAIRAAHEGKRTLAPEATEALVHAASTGSEDPGLTERELDILRAMVDGSNNAEIAEQLFISQSTVKFHVSNILMKMGAGTRTEAVSRALKEDLLNTGRRP